MKIAGKGEPLVLIHGSFGDRRFWDLQFTDLSKKYKVLRYDLRGYGRSAYQIEQKFTGTRRSRCPYGFFRNKKSTLCGLSSEVLS
jgi:pimeloyl-ACP methyl ester carboxylesterase